MTVLAGRQPTQPRDVGDLFGPFFRVEFLNVTVDPGFVEAGLNDTALGSVSNIDAASITQASVEDPIALDSRLLARTASNLTIESMAGSPFLFTVAFTPPYDDAIRILNNRVITFGGLVRVQFGYQSNAKLGFGLESDVHLFVINGMPKVDFGQDITITIQGRDLVSFSGMRNTSKKIYKRAEYANDFLIVREIAQKNAVDLDVSKVRADSTFFTPKIPGIPPSIEQHHTDWQFIRSLCMQHGLRLSAEGAVLKIYSPDTLETEPVAYRFLWRQKPISKRDIPVMNLTGNALPYLFQPPEGRSVVALKTDPDTGLTNAVKVTGAGLSDQANVGTEPSGAPGSSVTGNQPKSLATDADDLGEVVLDPETLERKIVKPFPRPNIDAGTVISQPNTVNNADERVETKVRSAVYFTHPMVRITTPGMPDVFPPMLVRLEGTSKLFDSVYVVLEAKHDIGLNGYTMDLKLIRHTAQTEAGVVPTGPIISPPAGSGEVVPEGPNSPSA